MARRRQARRVPELVVAAAVVPLGVAAELLAYDVSAVRMWVPDLAVGWGLVACGLVAWRIAPRSRCGVLLCAAGLVWFAGNFAPTDVPFVPWAAEHGAYVHRAALAAAVFAFALGRHGTHAARLATIAVCSALLWPPFADDQAIAVALALAVLVLAVSIGGRDIAPAALAFSLGVGGVAAVRMLRSSVDQDALLWTYDAGLLLTGALLVVALARLTSASTVAEHVIELGEATSVRDALRRVLDEPSLELAFARGDGHVDEYGESVSLTTQAPRSLTRLGEAGNVVVTHDDGLAIDGALAAALARALRLTRENALLQADVLEQLAELRASRRRLVLARGRQRARLARRLAEGAERHLLELDDALSALDPLDLDLAGAVTQARRRAREARAGIAELALGLQPRLLASGGLVAALAALAEGCPVPVSLAVDEQRFDAAVEHAAYLVCSEALANSAKHADATKVGIRLRTLDDRLRVEIDDDGRGGADRAGRGLRGLEQRVDELGGSLRIESPRFGGTRIRAEIPCRHCDEPGRPERLHPRRVPVAAGERAT